jgi:hypothetical protein
MSGATSPVRSGCADTEEAIVSSICEEERLTLAMRATARLVEIVDRGLASLDERDRRLLDRLYVHATPRALADLQQELCVEQAHLYRLRNAALKRFTISMYGVTEL